MIRALAILLSLNGFSPAFAGQSEPFMVETKVQVDLENSLSRLMAREQFLVQVNTEVVTRSERHLVEGETITVRQEPRAPAVQMMPGFLPEPEIRAPQTPPQTRETFRMVDTPVLNSVMVHVSFDEAVPLDLITRAKAMVQSYMHEAYPNRSVMTFSQIPMFKPKKAVDEAGGRDTDEEELTPEEKLWNNLRWVLLGLLGLVAIWLMRRPTEAKQPPRRGKRPESSWGQNPFNPFSNPAFAGAAARAGFPFGGGASEPAADVDDEAMLIERRKRIMGRFLMKSEAFRLYYLRLNDEEKGELYAALKGPGFESLLEGLSLPSKLSDDTDAHHLDERLAYHEKNFDEFALTRDWQDQQFFGYLQRLTDEQLYALISHESPLTICLVLRFLKASQSAFVLDQLPADVRSEVLAALSTVNTLPIAKILQIEKQIRTAAQRVPTHAFGSVKEDIDFWGQVLSESTDQDAILNELEKSQPEIYPKLTKFKFKLEDVGQLEKSILENVLSAVDNDELGLAMASCTDDAVKTMLGAVSPRRRDLLVAQVDTYRGIPREQTTAARLRLTKRFREAIA